MGIISPGIVIEKLLVEKLILVSTEPRKATTGQVPGYIFIDWGDTFREQHSIAFPDTSTHRLSVGLAAVGLNHMLKQSGSGYFAQSMVEELLENKTLYLVEDAPVFDYPIYMIYQENSQNKHSVSTAIKGLKAVCEK